MFSQSRRGARAVGRSHGVHERSCCRDLGRRAVAGAGEGGPAAAERGRGLGVPRGRGATAEAETQAGEFVLLFLLSLSLSVLFFFFFSVCMGTHEWAAKNLRADTRDGHLTPPFCGPSRTNADPADPVASGGRGLNVDFAAKKSGVPGVADRFDGEEAQGAKGGAQFLRAQDDPAGRLHCGVPEDPPGPPEEQRPGVQDLHERDAGARCHAMRVSDRSPLTTPFPPVVIPPARLGLVLTQRPLSSPKARVLPRVSDDGNEGEEAVPGLQEGHKEHEAGQEALPVGSTSPVLPQNLVYSTIYTYHLRTCPPASVSPRFFCFPSIQPNVFLRALPGVSCVSHRSLPASSTSRSSPSFSPSFWILPSQEVPLAIAARIDQGGGGCLRVPRTRTTRLLLR